jgi:hypothetical protein
MESQPIEIASQERLPWHKPDVQRLVISLDTRSQVGSQGDLLNGDNP